MIWQARTANKTGHAFGRRSKTQAEGSVILTCAHRDTHQQQGARRAQSKDRTVMSNGRPEIPLEEDLEDEEWEDEGRMTEAEKLGS